MLNVGIFGASGIGFVHARVFQSLGANVTAILGTTKDSAAESASALLTQQQIAAIPFSDIDLILEQPLDAVSICSPPSLHYQQLHACFDRHLPVLCEKPLLWSNDGGLKIADQLHSLKTHPNRQLFLNISNTVFIDSIQTRVHNPRIVSRFFFQFVTHGKYRGRDILVDLLPHGLSLIHRLFGARPIHDAKSEILNNKAALRFQYGNCDVLFSFEQDQRKAKRFYFEVDDQRYERIQTGFGNRYRVHLKDLGDNTNIEIEDPFRICIKNFIDYCRTANSSRPDRFEEAEVNVQLMNEMLNMHVPPT